tara:strand:+ start:2466 stop:3152 length:687 start_codon:yes stop_codon:yes gene_type:complete
MEVKSVFDSSFADVEAVGVAISRPKKRLNQQHIGLLYLDEDASPQLLHHAWHHDLRKESPSDKYLWLDIPLDPINKLHLATFCELVYEANKDGIPYGICTDGTGFSDDGAFTAGDNHEGLTCATFVAQVFHSQGFIIIDFAGWKHRKADKKWQLQILQNLKQSGASEEHLEHQRKRMLSGAARFKPEEVAISAAMPNPPHCGEAVRKPAAQLVNKIVDHTNMLAQRNI